MYPSERLSSFKTNPTKHCTANIYKFNRLDNHLNNKRKHLKRTTSQPLHRSTSLKQTNSEPGLINSCETPIWLWVKSPVPLVNIHKKPSKKNWMATIPHYAIRYLSSGPKAILLKPRYAQTTIIVVKLMFPKTCGAVGIFSF